DARGLGRGERLDVAVEDLDLGVARASDIGLELLAGTSLGGDPLGDPQQVPQAAVPPIVIDATRRVGCPEETGTPWPSLPHVPAHVSKSLPTASINCNVSGPLPMRLADRMGSVISPFSIMYASVIPNTNSPVAVLT